MNLIEESLKYTTHTRACVIGPGAIERTAAMFGELWPAAKEALVVDDVNTKRVAGERVIGLLRDTGVSVREHTVNPDGSWFHATYEKVEEVRDAISAASASAPSVVPVAVGSGTINDLVKRASDELGFRYMVVGTAASMDGYTAANAAITKDGMKQTLSCKAPLGCIVDSVLAAKAPSEMTASGYADLIAKIPAGADWMIADALAEANPELEKRGYERIHGAAWRFVQGPLRESLCNPAGCRAGEEPEVRKLCEGLVMSGFAMQAMDSSRPASGTEHQVSHYWDMEDLCFAGRPVSHGFKVGIGTLFSTKVLEFLLRQDISGLDVDAAVAAWPATYEEVKATFPKVFAGRPAHEKRAVMEYAKKFPSREELRRELSTLKSKWPALSAMIRGQLMPFDEVRTALKTVGAPVDPAEIGVGRERYLETLRGVPYMRARYFGLDLVVRLGLMEEVLHEV